MDAKVKHLGQDGLVRRDLINMGINIKQAVLIAASSSPEILFVQI